MNIGFVTTWMERGATYVTKSYMHLLEGKHNLFVYARGGEKLERGNPDYDWPNVTWGYRLFEPTAINWRHFSNWIKQNRLDVIFFNEQTDVLCVVKAKLYFPNIKIGAYIDYYTEATVKDFQIYDFLICNTKRHDSVFSWHKQAYYVPWGTDVNTFKYQPRQAQNEEIVFFHSVGMSLRKGTDLLVKAFIDGKVFQENAKLLIHTQRNIDEIITSEEGLKYNVEIIQKEVPAPGLYHLGDVYVYPTTLDGLGLTMYEALACGLPVITTDCAPMNEIINDEVGKLVKVEYYRARQDGYYWPLSIVNEQSLTDSMKFYCTHRTSLAQYKENARLYAEDLLNIERRKNEVCSIFENSEITPRDSKELIQRIRKIQKRKRKNFLIACVGFMIPDRVKSYYIQRKK